MFHLQDGLTQPWTTVTEYCTSSELFIILDALFEGPSMFTIIGNPISGGHNILMHNYGFYHRAGYNGTKIQVDLSYRRSRKFDIIGRFIFGQITDCWFPTSCNVNHHWVLFSVLVAHCTNHLRKAEEFWFIGLHPRTEKDTLLCKMLPSADFLAAFWIWRTR